MVPDDGPEVRIDRVLFHSAAAKATKAVRAFFVLQAVINNMQKLGSEGILASGLGDLPGTN